MEDQKSEATIFFLDEVIHQLETVIKKPPVKKTMVAYMSAWLNTLQTIKSLNKEN